MRRNTRRCGGRGIGSAHRCTRRCLIGCWCGWVSLGWSVAGRSEWMPRPLERRDTGQSYQEFLSDLVKSEGIANPTQEDCARRDRKRKRKRRACRETLRPPSGPRPTQTVAGTRNGQRP